MDEVILQTKRLTLRMFRESDLDAYADMCANAEVMRYIGGAPLPRAEAWRNMAMLLGHWYLRGYGLWAVEERRSGEMIGRVGCYRPESWPGLEVGWALRREFWGQGFATEAGMAALGYAFDKLAQKHVISLIHSENAASIRVAERLGEKLEGRAEVRDVEVLVYGISKKDWEGGR